MPIRFRLSISEILNNASFFLTLDCYADLCIFETSIHCFDALPKPLLLPPLNDQTAWAFEKVFVFIHPFILQCMRKIILLFHFLTAFSLGSGQAGTLNPYFGTGGYTLNKDVGVFNAAAVQMDGKTIAAGTQKTNFDPGPPFPREVRAYTNRHQGKKRKNSRTQAMLK